MEEVLVSVVIPVYNVENFLQKCVASVLNQTYRNLDIILVDDGSMDSSGKICDELGKCDERVTVIHKKNGGLSDARNAGLSVAKGEYYAFIDSDDYISLDMVEIMVNSVQKNNCDIAICNMVRFSESGESSLFYHPVDQEKVLLGEERFKTLNQPSVCNKLFSSNLFQNIRFPKGKYYEDTFVYHELLYRAENVVLTGSNSYWYLERFDSIVGSPKYTVRYFDFIEAVWTRAKFLIDNNVQPYGNEACLSLYAAFANAEKYIKKDSESKKKFKKAREQYGFAYKVLIKQSCSVGLKQKVRIFMLMFFPIFHSRIY